MSPIKSNQSFVRVVFTTFLILLINAGFTPVPDEISIEIDVAPNVLNLANQGEVVTVHTDIAYSAVEGASVTLNDIPIDWWKSDSRGYFVAKFEIDAVKGIVTTGTCTLELRGTNFEGELFSGSQLIKVINVIPAGKK
ncbi:MAG: hypothetical protein ABFS16_15045 [Bacteroidota bacterium]